MTDVLITITGLIVLIAAWVILYDSNRFVVRTYTVTDDRIKKSVRAVFLTDLHNKCYGKDNERLLEAIRGQHPDFILIAGDLLTARPKETVEPALRFLRQLAEDYPIYYANGNHEHRMKLHPEIYGDMAERYETALKEMEIDRLINRKALLPEYGIAVYGSEIDERYYKRLKTTEMPSDYLCSVLGQASDSMYTILLAHNPDYFPQYAAWGADLTLSGHVHGGVVRVPFWGKGLIAPSWHPFPRYDGGIFRENASVMVLSRGLGMHTVHVRLFNPAELWVIEFKRE